MKITTILLTITSSVATVLSAIFYVLFKSAKAERKLEDAERKLEAANTIEKINEKNIQERKANDELFKEAIAGNTVDNFNAGIDLMRNLQEKSKRRVADNNT